MNWFEIVLELQEIEKCFYGDKNLHLNRREKFTIIIGFIQKAKEAYDHMIGYPRLHTRSIN